MPSIGGRFDADKDADKKVKGRTRFIVTDILGPRPTVHVVAANVQDRDDGATRPLLRTRLDHSSVDHVPSGAIGIVVAGKPLRVRSAGISEALWVRGSSPAGRVRLPLACARRYSS
ncbi:hypothetical protein [Streptomyces prunicolor]